MLRIFWVALVVWWLAGVPPVEARQPEELQYLGQTTGDPIDPAKVRAGTLSPDGVPAALAAALARQTLRAGKWSCEPDQTLVFGLAGRPSFVARTWHCGDRFYGHMTLDRIEDGLPGERFIHLEGGTMTLVEPSGEAAFGDRAAGLFVEEASGGTGFYGYSLRIYRITDRVDDVTPPWRTVWAEPGNGDLLVMSSDDRWANFFAECGQCGPLVPVISLWRDGAFVPACKDRPDLIERRIELFRQVIAENRRDRGPVLEAVDAEINIALLHLQLGRPEQGRAAYDRGLERLRDWAARTTGDERDRARDWLVRTTEAFEPAIADAARRADRPCPLAAGQGSPR